MNLRFSRAETKRHILDLRREMIVPDLDRYLHALREHFPDRRVLEYIDRVRDDLLKHLDWFVDYDGKETEMQQRMERYDVNIIHDNGDTSRAPVIYEQHPSSQRLFGWQEHAVDPSEEFAPRLLVASGRRVSPRFGWFSDTATGGCTAAGRRSGTI